MQHLLAIVDGIGLTEAREDLLLGEILGIFLEQILDKIPVIHWELRFPDEIRRCSAVKGAIQPC